MPPDKMDSKDSFPVDYWSCGLTVCQALGELQAI